MQPQLFLTQWPISIPIPLLRGGTARVPEKEGEGGTCGFGARKKLAAPGLKKRKERTGGGGLGIHRRSKRSSAYYVTILQIPRLDLETRKQVRAMRLTSPSSAVSGFASPGLRACAWNYSSLSHPGYFNIWTGDQLAQSITNRKAHSQNPAPEPTARDVARLGKTPKKADSAGHSRASPF